MLKNSQKDLYKTLERQHSINTIANAQDINVKNLAMPKLPP